MLSKIKKELPYLVFVIPAVLIYTIFTIIPLISSINLSFTNWNGYSMNTLNYIGLSNYVGLFKDKAMIQSIINTFIYALICPIILTVFAIPLALILNGTMKTRKFQRAVFFFPSVPSILVIGYIWGYLLSSSDAGIINRFLALFGVKNILWLSDPKLAMLSIIMVAVWSGVGWHSCIYLAALQSIPVEYYEAAVIDGAGGKDQFRYITFPMLAPAMTISVLLMVTGSLKVFDLPFALTSGGPGYSTTMITQMIMTRGVVEKLYGKATAMSTIFFLIILVITVLQLTIMKRREEKLL